MKDLVTIILTAKNIEDFLPKCLKSLINQTYKALKILVVDDGSDVAA